MFLVSALIVHNVKNLFAPGRYARSEDDSNDKGYLIPA